LEPNGRNYDEKGTFVFAKHNKFGAKITKFSITKQIRGIIKKYQMTGSKMEDSNEQGP